MSADGNLSPFARPFARRSLGMCLTGPGGWDPEDRSDKSVVERSERARVVAVFVRVRYD